MTWAKVDEIGNQQFLVDHIGKTGRPNAAETKSRGFSAAAPIGLISYFASQDDSRVFRLVFYVFLSLRTLFSDILIRF